MKSITPDKLVSIILEEIKKVQAPNKPLYFDSLNDVMSYYGLNNANAGHETEMGEMAHNVKKLESLAEPMYIPIEEVESVTRAKLPKIRCVDPATGDFVEDVIIGDEVIELPNGLLMMKFQNYESPQQDRFKTGKFAHYIVLPENEYYKHPPRNAKYNTAYEPKDLSVGPEGESPKDRDFRLTKLQKENEAYAKRYVIFPAINNLFGRKDVLDRLDVSLIPETWANQFRTERTTNVEQRFKFGGNGTEIIAEFYAVRDFDDIESTDEEGNAISISGIENALNDIIKTRMDIEDGIQNRERNRSQTKPREYANYIYTMGGNWAAIQRIFDENEFKSAGEYTRILKLLKQNIQKGKKGMNVFSKLYIKGDVEGEEYVLKGTFKATLNYRTVTSRTGASAGDLFPPFTVEVRRRVDPDKLATPGFSVKTNKNFFGKASDQDGGEKGIFVELMQKMGDAMLDNINPDEVLGKISELLIPVNVDKNFSKTNF